MALVNCPECGKEISDRAPACPGCGRPMTPAQVTVQAAPVVTTQATGKGPKLLKLVGALLMISGFFTVWFAGPTGYGGPAFVLGLALWLAGSFSAWWRHG